MKVMKSSMKRCTGNRDGAFRVNPGRYGKAVRIFSRIESCMDEYKHSFKIYDNSLELN